MGGTNPRGIVPVVRAAGDQDLRAITAIYGHHVLTGTASFETEPPTLEEMARRRAQVLSRGLPFQVAELDGEIVGYAYAAPYRLRPAYRFTVEDSVYIHADRTRRGIGRQLLDAIICSCTQTGSKQMIAIIGDSENAASIRLHEAAGFKHVGVLRGVGLKFGRWLDTVIMQRALG